MNIKTAMIIGGVFIVGVGVLSKSPAKTESTNSAPATPNRFATQNIENTAVNDNMNDTLRTLLIDYENVKNELTAVKNQLGQTEQSISDTDKREIQNLRAEVEMLQNKNDNLEKTLRKEVQDLKKSVNTKVVMTQAEVEETDSLGISGILPNTMNGNLPLLNRPGTKPTSTNSSNRNAQVSSNLVTGVHNQEMTMWYRADDATVETDKNGHTVISYPEATAKNAQEASLLNDPVQAGTSAKKENTALPIYTIPALSTLSGATTVNAIIGRVPIGGTLTNPFRFKALIGSENMASNGHYIPGLQSMKVGGIAEGDFVMECARASINTVTYTFNDGRILTQRGDNLGYIADTHGNPCIPGLYISNFADYVKTKGSVSFMSALGGAIAETQVTTEGTGEDTVRKITGDALKYAGGTALQDSTSEVSDYFDKRMEDAFDAVWLEAGFKVDIHVEEELHIDYHKEGRKLAHYDNIEDFLE